MWLGLSVALLGFVLAYGPNVPWEDDWRIFVPVLTGFERPTASWLWYQYRTGHRMPVTKAVLYALSLPTHGDFRAGMVLSVLLLSAVSLGMIVMAARLRGRASYTDAFFPFVLLPWGQAVNVLHYCQVFFTGVLASYVGILLIILEDRWQGSRVRVVTLGAALLVLTLHGLVGPVYAAPFALWMVVAAVTRVREHTKAGRQDAAFLLTSVAAAIGAVVAYYVGFTPNPDMPASPSVAAVLATAVQALAVSLTALGVATWRISGVAIVGLTAATAVLVFTAGRRYDEWLRATGLLLAIGSVCGVVLAIGVGRSGLGPDSGLAGRYALLSVPVLLCVYYGWLLYGRTAGQWVQAALLVCGCAAAFMSVAPAREYGAMRRDRASALRRDIAQGLTIEALATSHYTAFLPWNRDLMRDDLDMLRRAGMGPYAGVAHPDAAVR